MIVQKPLTPLAAAVCNAGDLGSLACAKMLLNEIEPNISRLRSLTNKPCNLTFFLHQALVFDKELDAHIRKSVDRFYRKLGIALPADASINSLATFDDGVLALLNAKDDDARLSWAFSGRPCGAQTTPYSKMMARIA